LVRIYPFLCAKKNPFASINLTILILFFFPIFFLFNMGGSRAVFEKMRQRLREEKVDLGGVFRFEIASDAPDGDMLTVVVDAGHSDPARRLVELPPTGGAAADSKASVTISCSDSVFAAIASGERNSQAAFFAGDLSIAGDLGLAMRLGKLLGPSGGGASL
jgi:hypothetical protein